MDEANIFDAYGAEEEDQAPEPNIFDGFGEQKEEAKSSIMPPGSNLASKLLNLATAPTNLRNQALLEQPLSAYKDTTGADVIRAMEDLPFKERMKKGMGSPGLAAPAAIATGIKAVYPEDRSKLTEGIQSVTDRIPTFLNPAGMVVKAGGTLAGKIISNPEAGYGFGYDTIYDPLNAVGPGLGKGIKAAGSAAEKVGYKLSSLLPQSSLDALSKVKNALTERFVSPIHRVEEPVRDLVLNKEGDVNLAKHQIVERAQQQGKAMVQMFKDKKPLVDSELTNLLESKADVSDSVIPKLTDDPKQQAELKTLVNAKKQQFQQELELKKKTGIYTGEVEDIGYMPHVATDAVRKHPEYEKIANFTGMDKRFNDFNPSQLGRIMKKPDGSNYTIREANDLFAKGEFPGLKGVKIDKFFHDDPVLLGGISAYRTQAQVTAKEIYEDMKQFAVKKGEAGYPVEAPINGQNILEGKNFPKEIKQLIERSQNIMFRDEITTMFGQVTNFWKGLVTATPGFHSRNAQSNFIANAVEGVMPQHYFTAGNVQKGADGKIGKYAYSDIKDHFIREGLDNTVYGDNITKSIMEEMGPKARRTPFQVSREFGSSIETNAKMAHFIAKIESGKSIREAALSTKKTLFDYNDLTDFEKAHLKPVIPFYTWMRKNIPRQFELVATKPAYLSTQGNVMQNVESGEPITDKEREALPDYFDELLAFSAGKDPETKRRLFLSIQTPLMDLTRFKTDPNKTAGENFTDSARDFLGSLNPVMKAGLESVFEKSVFTGKDITKDEGGKLAKAPEYIALLPTKVQSIMGVKRDSKSKALVMPKYAAIWMDALTNAPQLRIVGKVGNDSRPEEEKAFALMSFALGLKIIPEDMKKDAVFEFKNKVKERQQTLQDKKRFRPVEKAASAEENIFAEF
jgi:hypothetical protein